MLSKDDINNFLDITEEIASQSKCIRRKFGAIIINANTRQIIGMGSNDVPYGLKTCSELGYCIRSKYNIKRGTRYELCRSVHAEQNAIIKSSGSTYGSILFLVGLDEDDSYTNNAEPCIMCKRVIINAGISQVICRINMNSYKVIDVIDDWVKNDKSMELIDSYTKGDTE